VYFFILNKPDVTCFYVALNYFHNLLLSHMKSLEKTAGKYFSEVLFSLFKVQKRGTFFGDREKRCCV
jgi:hypothetical protein